MPEEYIPLVEQMKLSVDSCVAKAVPSHRKKLDDVQKRLAMYVIVVFKVSTTNHPVALVVWGYIS